MWIRRTVRLCVVALFAIEISIIAMATAASAAPLPPEEEPDEEPASVVHFEDAFQAPPWITDLDLEDTYGGARSVAPRDHRDRWAHHRNRWADEHHWSASRPTRADHPAHAGDRETRKPGGAKPRLHRVKPRHAVLHMTHHAATRHLKRAGLRMTSSGGCVNRRVRHCTSLDSVRTKTVRRVVALKRRSGCPVIVTGGTETGHAPGRFSHGSGHKLDIGHNACIDRYIKKTARPIGVRGDGARLYRAPSGTVYADEGDHWDILFR